MASFKNGKVRFGQLETASSGGTLTLVASSLEYQIINGTLAHTVKLPDATTMATGLAHTVINASTGSVIVQLNDGSTTLLTLAAGQGAKLFLTDNSTSNGTWTTKAGGSAAAAGFGSVAPGTTIGSGSRAVFGGDGGTAIEYVIMATTSTAAIFGQLTTARECSANACASSTRGVWGGGGSSLTAVIDYITFDTLANALSFGSLTAGARGTIGACSNATRGLFAGGQTPSTSAIIEYITIASTGNSTSFGNLTTGRYQLAGCASTTRGVWGGGDVSGATGNNTIDYVTIASTGNATSFGTLTVSKFGLGSCSTSVRGIFGGGDGGGGGAYTAVIGYITIATTGNATSFGNLFTARRNIGAASSLSYGLFAGGQNGSGNQSLIDYVTIATTADALNFGNLTTNRRLLGGCSNAHGGL